MVVSKNLRVLVVDDDPLVTRFVKKTLSLSEFTVDLASSAEEAMTMLDSVCYRAVVTDYEMGGENGIWLLEKLMKKTPETCRILHSGSDLNNVEAHIKTGVVQCFLSKPAPQMGDFLRSLFLNPPDEKNHTTTDAKARQRWGKQLGQA